MASLVRALAGTLATTLAPGLACPSLPMPPSIDRDVAVRGDPADERDRNAPALAHLAHRREVLGSAGGEHSLLRLGDHDFPGRHAGLAARDRVEIQEDAGAGLVGRLRGRARDAACAEILDSHDQPAVDQLQAGLDEQLLRERVADLDRRPLRRVLVLERRRREHARSADAVAACRRAEQDDVVARSGRLGQDEHPLLEQADGHDVDERVALVARVEDQFAADGGHAHAVAVAADAADDAVHEMPGPRIRRIAEPQRVQDGDRAGAHGEDVAQDAAHAGRGALVRLHGGRVVVRFDLERDRQPVPDAQNAGVVAHPGHHSAALGRQGLEQRLGALVRAVLAPHHAEHGQLGVVGLPAELLADDLQLVVGDAELAMQGEWRLRRHRLDAFGCGRSAGGLAVGRAVHVTHRAASQARPLSTSERISCRPSSRPSIGSDIRSGWGIKPATLPFLLQTPAMARSEPFGLA